MVGQIWKPIDKVRLEAPAHGRGIYDNMKTAVETIFVGKGRVYNRRFLQMCSHYDLFEESTRHIRHNS